MAENIESEQIDNQRTVAVIGGILRLEPQYMRVLKEARFTPRIFNESRSGLSGRVDKSDVIILFVGTVSHKMAETARKVASVCQIPLVTIRPSSVSALKRTVEKLNAKGSAPLS